MSDKSSNPHLNEEAARIAQEWARDIHKDLVKKGLRTEEEEEEEDIVQEVKEVIQEVNEKTSEE
jgi:hypothetical protein